MGVTTNLINKPLNPRAQDASPLAYNRAALYSGKALDFDGVNDEVNCGDIDLAFSEISFAFHFNADSFSNNCIFQKESVFRFVGVNTNQIDIVLATAGNSWYSKKMTLTNLESKDYFLISTYDGSELKTYLNGVLVDTLGGYSGSVASVSQNVYVGRTNGGLYYNGKVSGARIFNTALTPAQIADLYNNPEKIVPTGVDNTALKLWLPMMEGAGTTAYDGSGNGNHGTISGATYTHGIGAPVSQTAVISWNKGTNIFAQSNDFSQSAWNLKNGTFTKGVLDPIGGNEAWSWTATDADPYIYQQFSVSGTHTVSIYAKGVGSTIGKDFEISVATTAQSFTLTSEWQRFELDGSPSNTNLGFEYGNPAVVGDVVHIFAAQLEEGATAGPYIPTLSTAQTTPVLLPAGLTTGRDITGVNLFENVRKQSALNLDGSSYAEVHDNESLDFGTGSFSIEAWVKVKYVSQGSAYNAIMTFGGDLAQKTGLALVSNLEPRFIYNGNVSSIAASTLGNWIHMMGVYNETNATFYVNGSQVDQDAKTAVNITNDLVKYIGRDTQITRYYNDQIAQPRIYNRALTASEVLRNYNSGKNTYTNS